MPCAKFRSNHFTATRIRAEWNFHQIWNTMEKSFLKWALYLYPMFVPVIACIISCENGPFYKEVGLQVALSATNQTSVQSMDWYVTKQRILYSSWSFGSKIITLTHWGRDKMAAIFNSIFLNENVWIPIKFSLKFVPKGPINNISALVQIMAWRHPGDKPLSEPMIVSLPTHICVTRPLWVNTLRLGHFQMHFLEWKVLYFDSYFNEDFF